MIYAIGDIHGQDQMLQTMLMCLRARDLTEDDTIVFIGDYIDRGPGSRAVIETLIKLRYSRPNVIFLRGNHEHMMLSAKAGPRPMHAEIDGYVYAHPLTLAWLQNGGLETLTSYEVTNTTKWFNFIPSNHWRFLEDQTQFTYETNRFVFVHAGLLADGETWEGADTDADPRLWIREPFLSSRHDFGKVVVFGHTVQPDGKPLFMPNKIGIDTGAVFGGPLTCAVLDDGKGEIVSTIQVHADLSVHGLAPASETKTQG